MRSEPGGAGVSQPAEPSLAVVLESSSTEHVAPVQSGVVGLAALPKPGVCVLELQRSMEVCVGRVIKAHLVPPPDTPQKMRGARATSTGNHLPTTGLSAGPDSLSPYPTASSAPSAARCTAGVQQPGPPVSAPAPPNPLQSSTRAGRNFTLENTGGRVTLPSLKY